MDRDQRVQTAEQFLQQRSSGRIAEADFRRSQRPRCRALARTFAHLSSPLCDREQKARGNG
jgi:hypothetical protein